MHDVDLLADHIRSVYETGAWTDVPVRAAFEALTHEEASARPIPGRHTAWEILLHMDAWHRVVGRRLRGEIVDLPPELDWPEPPASTAKNWRTAIASLDAGLEELLRSVRALSNDDLSTKLPGGSRTLFETIVGIGEHDLYHAGQVTLLKSQN